MVIRSHKSKGKRNVALQLVFLIVICFCLNYQIKKLIPDITLISGSLGALMNPVLSFGSKAPVNNAGSVENLPGWMQDYFQWHKQQRSQLNETNWKDQKYLILSCQRNHKCGGLADRLKPIPLLILHANRTSRMFMIYWDKPTNLEEFLEPNGIDWSVPNWMMESIRNKEIAVPFLKKLNWLHKLPNIAVYVYLQDFHGGMFQYDNIIKEIYNHTETRDRYSFIYHDLFRCIFKPSPPVQKMIDAQMKTAHITPGEYSIAHYRAFYAKEKEKEKFSNQSLSSNAINAANCASHLRPGGPVYFASDSKHAVDSVVDYGRKNNLTIVAYDGPEPLHIEHDWENRTVSEFYSIFSDLYVMGSGRCVAYGKGGFGRFALLMGFNSSCYFQHKGKKCDWKEKESATELTLKKNLEQEKDDNILDTLMVAAPYDPNRLCTQNQYAKSLNMSLSEYAVSMDKWMDNKVEIERIQTKLTKGHEHNWDRFGAFEEMGGCTQNCIGGPCRNDKSKITCGVNKEVMEAPCVVYSIGSNNQWQFELDVLAKTPCEVHTFDCTGPKKRFKKPDNDRSHFHHVCLGTKNVDAPAPEDRGAVHGEFWTLSKMQQTLKHTQIDLFKADIEGYEFPMFEAWPILTEISAATAVLPMQVLVEIHYQTQMPELSWHKRVDWKFSNDMVNLQERFLKMGYAVVVRDDNAMCRHCTELTLVRIRCPAVQ